MPSNNRLLAALEPHLDTIEAENEWEYNFVTDLMERLESGKIEKLTDKQFLKLNQIHNKYILGVDR